LERTWAMTSERTILLALDWAKAFDSISPASLMRALLLFGMPRHLVDMIFAIYSSRDLAVRECGASSEVHE